MEAWPVSVSPHLRVLPSFILHPSSFILHPPAPLREAHMPDLRKDPIVGRWVIVAKSRAKRPHDFDTSLRRRNDRFCPLCEGNEDKTPDEIIAYRNPGSQRNRSGWRVRVVPNKFPALEIEGDLNKRGEGIYDMMRGVGAHEVIIECPSHLVSTAELTEEQLR